MQGTKVLLFSCILKVYMKPKLKVQVTKYSLDFIIFFTVEKEALKEKRFSSAETMRM